MIQKRKGTHTFYSVCCYIYGVISFVVYFVALSGKRSIDGLGGVTLIPTTEATTFGLVLGLGLDFNVRIILTVQ